jgi:hypothetical protein
LWWAGSKSPPGEAWQQFEGALADAYPRALSLRYLPFSHPRMDDPVPGLRLGTAGDRVTVRTALFYSAIWMG